MAVQAIKAIAQPTAIRRGLRRGFQGAWLFARRYPLSGVGGAIVLFLIFVGVAAPLLEPEDPLKTDIPDRLNAPSLDNLLGTDFLGRDILSRIIRGTRNSLRIAFVAVFLGTLAGSLWGVVSGYVGGAFDLLSQRIVEIFQSFPAVLLALVIATAFGTGFWTVVAVIAVTRVSYGTRIIRAQAMAVKEATYVDAARAIGASPMRIMALHVAPQCFAPFVVLVTIYLGVAIGIEATLGFLGIGLDPIDPTWGSMLGEASSRLKPPLHLAFFPGAAITIAILGLNLVGDGIRDALDPRLRGATT